MKRFSRSPFVVFIISVVSSNSGIGSGFTLPAPAAVATRTTTTKKPCQLPRGGSDASASTAAASSFASHLAALAVPTEILTSVLPASFGFVRSEFGVSYGYGLATSLTGLTILRKCSQAAGGAGGATNSIFPLHAMALIFYGTRLNAFLAIRVMLSAKMRGFVKTIEDRAKARGSRLSRAPFLLSCGFLYYGLAAPLLLTSKLTNSVMSPSWAVPLMKALVALEWFGFGMAALADLTKSFVKQTKGENTLVTSGIFSILRHPNYTGEIIGWTANALCGLIAFILLAKSGAVGWPALLGTLSCTAIGWAGIVFVLLQATRRLEASQKRYSNNPDYAPWVASTWSGWMLPPTPKKKKEEEKLPQIILDENQVEEAGSGI